MQIKPSLLAVCLSALLSSSFAATAATAPLPSEENFVPPTPLTIIPPTRAPAGYENATIQLKLVVDARGLPQQIDTLGVVPVEVRELVIGAVKEWKFSPATRNGIPVSVCIILPLKLATADY